MHGERSPGRDQAARRRPAADANKCGYLPPFNHEGCHVTRRVSGGRVLSYAFAVLSRRPPDLDLMQLGRDLDDLIDQANP